MNNSLNSFSSFEKVSNLLSSISDTCDSLLSVLDVNTDEVCEYTQSVSTKLWSEFFDIATVNFIKLKQHILDLSLIMSDVSTYTEEELLAIEQSLLFIESKIQQLSTNYSFKDTFALPISELLVSIKSLSLV